MAENNVVRLLPEERTYEHGFEDGARQSREVVSAFYHGDIRALRNKVTSLEKKIEKLQQRLKSESTQRESLQPADLIRRGVFPARWDGFDTFTVEQVGEIFGICRGAAYAAVRNGTIGSIRIGKRYIVPRRVVEDLLGC